MNIDDLTLGEVKQLTAFLKPAAPLPASDLYSRYIGQYVICRSRNEGINAGEVVAVDSTGVILKDCRRLWYHKPVNKNKSWYEGVACDGVHKDSKLSAPVEKIIAEDYSLTICTDKAAKSIKGADTHEQG